MDKYQLVCTTFDEFDDRFCSHMFKHSKIRTELFEHMSATLDSIANYSKNKDGNVFKKHLNDIMKINVNPNDIVVNQEAADSAKEKEASEALGDKKQSPDQTSRRALIESTVTNNRASDKLDDKYLLAPVVKLERLSPQIFKVPIISDPPTKKTRKKKDTEVKVKKEASRASKRTKKQTVVPDPCTDGRASDIMLCVPIIETVDVDKENVECLVRVKKEARTKKGKAKKQAASKRMRSTSQENMQDSKRSKSDGSRGSNKDGTMYEDATSGDSFDEYKSPNPSENMKQPCTALTKSVVMLEKLPSILTHSFIEKTISENKDNADSNGTFVLTSAKKSDKNTATVPSRIGTHKNNKKANEIANETVLLNKRNTNEISNKTVVLDKKINSNENINETVVLDKRKNANETEKASENPIANETVVLEGRVATEGGKNNVNQIANETVVLDKGAGEDAKLVENNASSKKNPKGAIPIFNPYLSSPVKQRVEAYEKLVTPSRVTRTKTRRQAKAQEESDAMELQQKSQEPEEQHMKLPKSLEKKIVHTPINTKNYKPQSASKLTKSTSASKLPATKIASALKASQQEYRQREESRRKKEEEALRKREALLHAGSEEKRRKREEKELRAKQQREVKEKEKRKALALQQMLTLEKQEKLQRLRDEELERRRQAAKEKYEERKREAERRQAEEEARLLAKHRTPPRKGSEPPIYKMQAAPLLPSYDCYDSDDPNAPKQRPERPAWVRSEAMKTSLGVMYHIGDKLQNTLFCVKAQTLDLRDIFHEITPRKLKRNSSAIWNYKPRFTLMPGLDEEEL